jgi:hypothetical protein
MHKNTLIVVIILTVFTVLVAGVNILHWVSPSQNEKIPTTVMHEPTVNITPIASPTAEMLSYADRKCGISISYPKTHSITEDANGDTQFLIIDQPVETVILHCQKTITPPAVTAENIRDYNISSISAKIYTDVKPSEGKPGEKLIFRNPLNNLDIQISGAGEAFRLIIASIKVL